MSSQPPDRLALSARDFQALSRGGGGSSALTVLQQVRRSRLHLLLWNLMRVTAASGGPQAEAASCGYRLLAAAQRRDPAAAATVLDLPAVHGWALSTTRDLGGAPETADLGRLALIGAAAAVRAGLPFRFDLPVPDTGGRGPLHLPSLGLAVETFPGHRLSAVFEDGTLGLDGGGRALRIAVAQIGVRTPGWLAERSLVADSPAGSLRVLMDELDPYRCPVGLTPTAPASAEELEQWSAALRAAWELLSTHHARHTAEIRMLVSAFCPLAPPDGRTVSATSRALPGSVSLTLPRTATDFALALVHEVQHVKLAALMDLVPLLAPGSAGKRYYAPWRDDPRPLSGLLQGTYAHLGVSGFWRRQCAAADADPEVRLHAQTEFARWSEAAAQTARFLAACADLTPAGRRFSAGMAAQLGLWQRERVPAAARVRARRAARVHLAAEGRAGRGELVSRISARPDSRTADC